MFMGVIAHHKVQRVGSYADAQLVLAAAQLTPTGRRRSAKACGFPLGGHYKSVTWVRDLGDESIAFRLYDTDVVVWHPDGSFTMTPWRSQTTVQFADRFTPDDVRLGSDATATYFLRSAGEDWYARWKTARICRGDATFRQADDGWAPDEETLAPITFLNLDRKLARKLSREHHLKDFLVWLSMAPRHMQIEHHNTDCGLVAEFLQQRDFKSAAMHLPLIEQPRGFGIKLVPLPIVTGWTNRAVTMTSVQRFRDWLYFANDAFGKVSLKTLPLREFENRRKRVKQLENVGCYVSAAIGI